MSRILPILALAAIPPGVAILVVRSDAGRARPKPAARAQGRTKRGHAGSATSPAAVAAKPQEPDVDPFATKPMRSLLQSTSATVDAAVEDLKTRHTFVYHPHVQEQTASIMKVDILETLLDEAQEDHTQLDSDDDDRAQRMIENSDNDDAQALWDAEGGSTAVADYDDRARLSETVPNPDGYWGESTTTAPDQLKLLKQLVIPDGLLDRSARHYELSLMRNIEADQQWGVSGGIPASADVALKNGWLPLTSTDWQVNSIGRVSGDGRSYLIAVLTTGDPTEGDGIDTIQQISALVWKDLS